MSYKCEYCQHDFREKRTLKVHQTTAKYCLKLRGKKLNGFKCEGCKKNLTSNYNLSIHKKSCIKKNFKKELAKLTVQIENYQKENEAFKIENKLLKEQVENLQDGLFRVAERPTTTKIEHQVVQHLVQITPEHLEKSAENLTINHIERGVDGYKTFLLDYPLKNSFITNDYSRRIISFVDEDGKVVVDPNMTKLLQRIFKAIMSKNTELISERIEEIVEYANQNPDNLCPELLALQWDKQRDMLLNKELVDEVGNGSVNGLRQNIAETYQALIRGLCKYGMCSKELQTGVQPAVGRN